MVLFTKEVFVQYKSISSVMVVPLMQPQFPGQAPNPPLWQVQVTGAQPDNAANNNMNMGMGDMPYQTIITCESREDAQKLFKEIIRQVVDSGQVTELNDKLFDDVIKEK